MNIDNKNQIRHWIQFIGWLRFSIIDHFPSFFIAPYNILISMIIEKKNRETIKTVKEQKQKNINEDSLCSAIYKHVTCCMLNVELIILSPRLIARCAHVYWV